MKLPKRLRDAANRLFLRPATNDNPEHRFRFTVSAEEQARAAYPPTDNGVIDILHGEPVSDPFRPLEDLDATATAEWSARQNLRFDDFIKDNAASIKAAADFMQDALDYDSTGLPNRYGDLWFRGAHTALAAQGTVEVAESRNGPWRTLFDPNAMSEDGTVALSGWTPSPDGTKVAYLVSEAGSDAQTLRIRDTVTGQDLPDVIENCRFTSILWDKDSNASFQYTYPTHDDTKRNIVKHHVIGTPVSEDKTIFERPEENGFVSSSRLRAAKYEWMYHSIGTDNNHGLWFRPFGSEEPLREINPPKTFSILPVAELDDGTVLAVTNKDAPHGKLVRFNPAEGTDGLWQDVLPQHDEDILDSVKAHKGKLYAFYTHDTADIGRVFDMDGKHLHDMPIPLQSTFGMARTQAEDDIFTLRVSGFTSAGDTYEYDTRTNELALTEKGPGKANLNDCIVERIHATSKDGTKVPMTVIRHPDTKLDGTAAVKLYGYGGFNVPLTPGFSSGVAQFVRAGGIYVQANLRGGGEFGEDWYNGGRGASKQNVFDDFIACAEHLVSEKYTSQNRLVINGGSNGGLLTSACMLQRPDLFGAVITEVAVTDMFRFHLGTYGGAWKSDYGDPDVRDDFNVAAAYSPLHNVTPGAKYPPHLIKTADHDDRVLPWHSFKLAATLQARSHPDNVTLLRVEERAGHGAGMPLDKYIEGYAETFAFIERAIGPVNQQTWQAKLAAERQAKKKPRFPHPFRRSGHGK